MNFILKANAEIGPKFQVTAPCFFCNLQISTSSKFIPLS